MRTNEQRVANLVHTDSPLLITAIQTASVMVDNIFANTTVSEELLAEIETLLAAHFLLQNPAIRKETGNELLQYKEGLKNTSYGQQAIIFDPTGKLGTLNKTRTFEFEVL